MRGTKSFEVYDHEYPNTHVPVKTFALYKIPLLLQATLKARIYKRKLTDNKVSFLASETHIPTTTTASTQGKKHRAHFHTSLVCYIIIPLRKIGTTESMHVGGNCEPTNVNASSRPQSNELLLMLYFIECTSSCFSNFLVTATSHVTVYGLILR